MASERQRDRVKARWSAVSGILVCRETDARTSFDPQCVRCKSALAGEEPWGEANVKVTPLPVAVLAPLGVVIPTLKEAEASVVVEGWTALPSVAPGWTLEMWWREC